MKQNTIFFHLPTISCFFRFQKQFLTTYGGQIEETRVFFYLPTVNRFVRFQKQFLTTCGGQIEKTRGCV